MNEPKYEIFDKSGNKIKNLDKEILHILLIPYTYNPDESFHRTVNIVRFLRQIHNILVFSPILHSHGYNEFLMTNQIEYGENYYDWDLKLYEAFKNPKILIFTRDFEISEGCKMEMEWAKKEQISILYLQE